MVSEAAGVPAVFSFEERAVRTVEIGGVVWFVGRDVCDCLGHKNHSQALARLSEDERDGLHIVDPIGRAQINTVVSEAGVYQLIFTSRVESAQRFKRWLAHEVLPEIRRKGSFAAPPVGIMLGTREFMDAIQAVRELRLLAGKRAALDLWRALGMPAASKSPAPLPLAPTALVRKFLSERTMRRGGCVLSGSRLWLSFEAWCKREVFSLLSRDAFSEALRATVPDHREVDGEWLFEGVHLFADHCG